MAIGQIFLSNQEKGFHYTGVQGETRGKAFKGGKHKTFYFLVAFQGKDGVLIWPKVGGGFMGTKKLNFYVFSN